MLGELRKTGRTLVTSKELAGLTESDVTVVDPSARRAARRPRPE
ncbi:hypothetical protein [Nonomuraea wenchangensis]|nr:hypothetical protein [Nonomuraea wenchangensis]